MALPKKKTSRARRDRRRAHEALDPIHLVPCPQCREMTRPHHICPACGTFRGTKYLATDDQPKQK